MKVDLDVNIDTNVLKDFLDAHQNYFSELMNEYKKKLIYNNIYANQYVQICIITY